MLKLSPNDEVASSTHIKYYTRGSDPTLVGIKYYFQLHSKKNTSYIHCGKDTI